jgi:zinc and cadmium transporter
MIIFLYCGAIALGSLAGGYLPLSKRISHLSLQVYLGLSAGAMLGAACFHMLPEGAELAGGSFGLWLILGVLGLYMIERFLSPHSHASSEEHGDDLIVPDGSAHLHTHPPDHAHHHSHSRSSPGSLAHSDHVDHSPHLHSAAPRVAGWSAVAGLSIHTVLGGVALGSAVLEPDAPKDLGFAVFLATVLHKPADSLTISTLLLKGGTSRRTTFMVQLGFALLIPLGVLLFYLGRAMMTSQVDSAFTGCVLAFSAGTFLCIALSDLLPEVQFHSHDRLKLFLAVIAGAAIMGATSQLEGHSQEHAPNREAQPVKLEGVKLR